MEPSDHRHSTDVEEALIVFGETKGTVMTHDNEWNSVDVPPMIVQRWDVGIEGDIVAEEPGDLGAILRRIDELLRLNGLTMRGASLPTGNPDYIRNMKRQYAGKTLIKDGKRVVQRQYSADYDDLMRLVEPLNTTPEWLWKGKGVKFVPRERDDRPKKPTRIEKEKAGRERYRIITRTRTALRTEDEAEPATGKIVIISRTKSGLVETTTRRFNLMDDQVELASSDQGLLRLTFKNRKAKIDEDTEIELRGVVVFVYRQV